MGLRLVQDLPYSTLWTSGPMIINSFSEDELKSQTADWSRIKSTLKVTNQINEIWSLCSDPEILYMKSGKKP